MIYIIIDKSHEWDEEVSEKIVYVNTKLLESEYYFESHFNRYESLDDSKWCYEAELYEYPDKWWEYATVKPTLLRHIDNVKE